MKISVLSSILFIFSFTSYGQQTTPDSVTVTFEVVTPESTPDNATIFWAGSLNNWDPGDKGSGFSAKELARPLEKIDGTWQIKLTAAKDDTVRYKFARGSIFSVEEQADFTYRPVRTVVFDQLKTVHDTVAAWQDQPPESLADQWPIIDLKQTEKAIAYSGRHMPGLGTLLYDKNMSARFYSTDNFNTQTEGIPENIGEHVFYFHKVSEASDNTILILAGQINPDEFWNVYVDQNNDNRIDPSELIFTADTTAAPKSWNGNVRIQTMTNDSPTSRKVHLTINHATDLPEGYRSSVNTDAPNLTYLLPWKQRKGTLEENSFYLSAMFERNFSSFFNLNVDRDRNDTLEIGSGSNEVSSIDLNSMCRQQKFYIHPTFQLGEKFWKVVTVDPEGTRIRLRPAPGATAKANIKQGKPAPAWEATTVEDKQISSESMRGTYLLLDFWGSWCGPCIDEIPKLEKVYQQFKSQNFEMIGFAYESAASLNRALEHYELPWPQVLDDNGEYSAQFLVRGYPTKYLISPDGTVLETGSELRGDKLVKTLKKYLE